MIKVSICTWGKTAHRSRNSAFSVEVQEAGLSVGASGGSRKGENSCLGPTSGGVRVAAGAGGALSVPRASGHWDLALFEERKPDSAWTHPDPRLFWESLFSNQSVGL